MISLKKHAIGFGAALALAISAGLAAAQTYPVNNPVYTPTAQKAVATFTATGDYTFSTQGLGTASVRVVKGGSATYTGAIQVSNDNTNWTTVAGHPVGGGANATSMSASGFWRANVAGFAQARFHITAVGGTGGLTVQMSGTPEAYSVLATPQAATGGGISSAAHVISAATTNSTSVASGEHQLYVLTAANTNAAAAYLKLYDTAAGPTCNSDTVLMTFTLIQNVPRNIEFPVGLHFANGIGLCITGAAADNDNTAATTGIVVSAAYQ